MSAVESALDVLSRAATMVQEERPKVSTGLHRKPSSAWRRERRRDPIQSEALDMSSGGAATAAESPRSHHHHQQQQRQHSSSSNSSSRPSVIVPVTSAAPQPAPGLHSPSSNGSRSEGSASADFLAATTTEDTAVTPTASATPSAATRGQRTGVRSTPLGASDAAIDEHFKRSLGLKEYAAVFDAADKPCSADSVDKEPGLTVDDHFAKALGETWTRLQASTRSKQST